MISVRSLCWRQASHYNERLSPAGFQRGPDEERHGYKQNASYHAVKAEHQLHVSDEHIMLSGIKFLLPRLILILLTLKIEVLDNVIDFINCFIEFHQSNQHSNDWDDIQSKAGCDYLFRGVAFRQYIKKATDKELQKRQDIKYSTTIKHLL